MPPKKQKVKVRKSSKRGDKGVNIKIVIDQSKKTRGGVAPKASTGMRTLPAFSAMPQGSSFLGASYPNRQDAPAPSVDTTAIGDRIFNQLLEESNRRQQSARGFGGFQTSGEQLNQIYDGQYSRMGRNNAYIISNPNESSTARSIDNAVFDDPETNNQILGNKLNSRGSQLPHINENSIGALNEDDRRDNDLDNLVLHEKKSKMEATVNADLDEDLLEEEGDEDVAISEVKTAEGQAQRAKEIDFSDLERRYGQSRPTKDILARVYENYPVKPYPNTSEYISPYTLRDYIISMNKAFGTNYPSDFTGKNVTDKMKRVIRIGFLKAYDDL